MRWYPENRRDLVTGFLVAALLILGLFVAFELARGLHRYHGFSYLKTPQSKAPAGVVNAKTESENLELFGWAPALAEIQLRDQDQVLEKASVSAYGKWKLSFEYKWRRRVPEILSLQVQEKDKVVVQIGTIIIFMPEQAPDDAYIWMELEDDSASVPLDLLQAPTTILEGDLFLALIRSRVGQPFVFAGMASPGSFVQLYADRQLVGKAITDNKGYWNIYSILGIDRKLGTLRLDEVEERGGVADRRSYHFEWPENTVPDSSKSVLLKADDQGWLLGMPAAGDRAELVRLLVAGAGESMSTDETIPGEIIPQFSPSELNH